MGQRSPSSRSHRCSYLGWACIGAACTIAGWLDVYAIRHQDEFTTMTEDTYRLHRLVRATVIGAASAAAWEHFVVADR